MLNKFKNAICTLVLLSCYYGLAMGKAAAGIIELNYSLEFPKSTEQRPLLANTKIYVQVQCLGENTPEIQITWKIAEHPCIYEERMLKYSNEDIQLSQNSSINKILVSSKMNTQCTSLIVLRENQESQRAAAAQGTLAQPVAPAAQGAPVAAALVASNASKKVDLHPFKQNNHPFSPTTIPIYTVAEDGIYELELNIQTANDQKFNAIAKIEFLGPHGYVSAIDWPFLPFYLIMCIVYVIFGIIWLMVSFSQWRDLLRIQFWIGGVILLGMLEKAFFYAEYHTLNSTGIPPHNAELVAEFVSCAKRTLARMLVIIMSLGFGIVKPRLGPMLHRVVGVGTLYFVLACVESYLRVNNDKSQRNELLVASIPLAVLDTGICWWIFTSLVQTTRTLRLRRNMVKLALYRHFTNTLIFAVIASVIFMLFALRLRSTENCTPGWRDIWVDTAFWHILFSVLLLVIMILWRPTNNNQRYAFTPLLDNPEDEDDEEEEDQFVADAYGIKMRGSSNGNVKTSANSQHATTTEEDDLRWVEENIPSSMADPALPVLDSDEEIINTKFEVSKMQ